MSFIIRRIARFSALLLAVLCAHPADAQTYPSRPVRIIVPWPAGGGVDVALRIISPKLTEALGRPVIQEFHAGAAGIIGTDMAAKAAPDGYTLLGVFDNFPLSQHLFKKVPYDAVKDFAPISLIIRGPMILVAPPQLGIKDFNQFLQFVKSKGGSANYASAGAGTSSHLSVELFKLICGIDAQPVHYKGAAPAMADVMGGHADFMIIASGTAMPQVTSGKLAAIASSATRRVSQMPNVPAIAEFYPGFQAQSWIGILAPAATPVDIVRRVNAEIGKALADRDVIARYEELGVEAVGGTPESFARWIAEESDKWGKVIKQRKITLD